MLTVSAVVTPDCGSADHGAGAVTSGDHRLGWAGLGWAGLGWAGLGWLPTIGPGVVTLPLVTAHPSSFSCQTLNLQIRSSSAVQQSSTKWDKNGANLKGLIIRSEKRCPDLCSAECPQCVAASVAEAGPRADAGATPLAATWRHQVSRDRWPCTVYSTVLYSGVQYTPGHQSASELSPCGTESPHPVTAVSTRTSAAADVSM